MSDKIEEKQIQKAQNFIIGAKKEFKKFIPRDTIEDISVTDCIEEGGNFVITGSVGTLSPTKKEKTFRYSAAVNVDESGKCSLANLQVSEL